MSRPCWTTVLALTLFALAGCGTRQPPLVARLDRALATSARFLLAQQNKDGAWYSEAYGTFQDGASLTPVVVQTLRLGSGSAERDAACRRGLAYLVGFAQPDGTIQPGPHGFNYHVYTAASVVAVLSSPDQAVYAPARDAWLASLRQRQLTEALGWQPDDREYGGWGFCPTLPRKPPAGQLVPPLTESNLSATLFAVEALRAAGVPADDPLLQKARVFIERCQNYGDDPAFDDGGFHFIYEDIIRNKAGVAGTDQHGRERFHSYGSMTADGVRALLACGLAPDHPRVTAARRWLEVNFNVRSHPGRYTDLREPNREAVYYYYAWSLAAALSALDVQHLNTAGGKIHWPEALAEELLKRQRADGSWSNPAVMVREDDPLVATPLAVQTLALCRTRLTERAAP